jgi:Zn-dependent M32 family carboxypeptidase|tara:strand:+ start:188 stop:484 length:297 start_codon:yes stop_codon:yes gene_type:complete
MKKSKGYTREFRNDDPTTALSHEDQQKAMLLDLYDDEMERKKIKKINKFVEPQLNKDLDQFAESRARYETRKAKRKAPEKIEKNFGLARILQVSKSKK